MIDTDIESGRDLAAPPVPDGVIGPRFKRSIPAPPSPLRAKQSKDMEAEDTARHAAAAAQDDPELLELEAKYLHKTFSDDDVHYKGKGKGKRSAPADRYVVHAISWSVEQGEWVAECVLLDSSGAIPESSKTALGKVLREAVEYYCCQSLDAMMD